MLSTFSVPVLRMQPQEARRRLSFSGRLMKGRSFSENKSFGPRA